MNFKDDCKTIVEVHSTCIIPFYPSTQKSVTQLQMQQQFNAKAGLQNYLVQLQNGTIVNTEYDVRALFQQTPMSVPGLGLY